MFVRIKLVTSVTGKFFKYINVFERFMLRVLPVAGLFRTHRVSVDEGEFCSVSVCGRTCCM